MLTDEICLRLNTGLYDIESVMPESGQFANNVATDPHYMIWCSVFSIQNSV